MFKRSHHEGRIYLHPSLPPPVASDTSCPPSELGRRRGRAKIDNDIICNVDHVCVKPDDGTRQIHIKIFYKYTRPEYQQQPLRVSQRPPAWLSWIQSVGTSQARVPSPHPASPGICEENIRDVKIRQLFILKHIPYFHYFEIRCTSMSLYLFVCISTKSTITSILSIYS